MDESIKEYISNKNLLNIDENDILKCYENQEEIINFNIFYDRFKNILFNEINKQDNIVTKNHFDDYDNKINKINNIIETYQKNINELLNIKNNLMIKKVDFIGKLKQPEQRSKQWYDMRENMLTASDIGAILGYSKYTNRNAVIKKKCGMGPKFTGNKYTLHGQKYEQIASQIYQLRYNKNVKEYGLIQHPEIDILGASPDGISTDGIMLEIKCPPKRKITGDIPEHYWVQMQVQLQVCRLEQCDFIECLIEEYEDYEEYKQDIFEEEDFEYYDILPKTFDINHIKVPNDRKTVYGLEKGVLGEIRELNTDNKYESKFFYPPFDLNTNQQIQWLKNKEIEINQNIELCYWKLIFSSVVNVFRDDNWWKSRKVVEQLNDTWNEILKTREEINEESDGITVDFSNLTLENDDLPKCEISSEDEENISLNNCLLSDTDD